MRIIFMGTPDFSVGTLEMLIQVGHEIVLAVTQPDKPKGRHKAMQPPPVKEAALAHGIEVYQPRRVREPECIEYLRRLHPDIIVVVAFGQILPKEILELPPKGCINVHASLLPKYRGAAPIQWAVINGEPVTGVTTMRMDEGLDTGDIILKTEVPLQEGETGGTLFERLAKTGAELCIQTIQAIQQGTATYTPQDHSSATHTTIIKKQLGQLDWAKPAKELERLIRGLNPWPSAYTYLDGKTLKIWKANVQEENPGTLSTAAGEQLTGTPETHAPDKTGSLSARNGYQPGTITAITRNTISVQTGQGTLILEELQLEGKKRMPTEAFLRGFPLEPGHKLG